MRRALPAVLLVACACQKVPEDPTPPRVVPRITEAPPGAPSIRPRVLRPLASAADERCVDPGPATPPAAPPRGPAKGCPPDPERAPPLPRATIGFLENSGARLDAEIARSERDVTRGLMYRTEMGEDQGMFFRLESRRVHTFWMHNTCIPLDMLFVDEDGTVAGIVENVPTLNDDPRKVSCPSLYVLETNAGWSRRHSVRPGHKLVVPDLAR